MPPNPIRPPSGQTSQLEAFFLPDLCNARAIVYLLMVTEGVVIALNLMESGLADFSWQRFGMVSLFIQWVALVSVALLCQSRHRLAHLAVWQATAFAMLLVQLVTLMVSLAAEALLPHPYPGVDWLWVARNLVVSALVSALALRYFYVQSQWRLQAQAELRARLSALQANIRPHFFFNTLNTVASLIVVDPDKAETMLVDLAQLFRAVLKADDQPSSLQKELALGRRYLDIETIRLGDRLQIDWQIPADLPNVQIPALLLQPLLENAVYHGIQPQPKGGDIHIQVAVDDAIAIEISNSKMAESGSTSGGNGIALNNIRARLQTRFGDQAKLITTDQGTRYCAVLTLPLLDPPSENRSLT
ncbi:MAG: histidine kinase [Oceanospirillaceae bacterium]|nr:histidine kinase [Oceanospirillaceae bacterium]